MGERVQRLTVGLSWLVGVALTITAVHLARTNRALAAQVERYTRSIEMPAGARVPPLVGWDRTGQQVTIDSEADTLPVLLLVFSASCPACLENWPNWDDLIERQQDQGGRIVPVDLTGLSTDDYLKAHGIDSVPVIDSISRESLMAYSFRLVPQTFVLRKGIVKGSWIGVLSEDDFGEAVAFLTANDDSLSAVTR